LIRQDFNNFTFSVDINLQNTSECEDENSK
jgi:hypothetical protein